MTIHREENPLRGELSYYIREIINNQQYPFIIKEEKGKSDILILHAVTENYAKPFFSIECKDPRSPEGKSVYNPEVFKRELNRSKKLKINTFGITNFIEAAVFDFRGICSDSICDDLVDFKNRLSFFDFYQYTERDIKTTALDEVLKSIAEYYINICLLILKNESIPIKPLDERFIWRLKSLMYPYIFSLTEFILNKLNDSKFKKEFFAYINTAGWNAPAEREDFLKIAHLALLELTVKLIFYKVFESSAFFKLPQLVINEKIVNPLHLRDYLWNEYFIVFVKKTGDYESVFGEKEDFPNNIIFEWTEVIDFVREIVHSWENYNFSEIPQDVIGKIFEKLIREEERHKMGQYFTPLEVVDLINSFCIKDGNERVLDPTAGSGTFLVRAYYRKKTLTQKDHSKLLDEIYGIDIASYAVYLATVNLAIRDFRYKAYPKIYHKDCFDLFFEKDNIEFFDAIVGNPPYTRQEELDDVIKDQKSKYHTIIQKEWSITPAGRSSLYALILYHAGFFLKNGGRLGFLISNSWMQMDFGVELKRWMLKHFKIIAIIESSVERFFPDALVDACILILERSNSLSDEHQVKFVNINKKLSEILSYKSPDEICELIESTKHFYENDAFRVLSIKQSELIPDNSWGKYLRATHVWRKIEKKITQIKFGSIINVRAGIKSGDNDFFYLEDLTNQENDEILKVVRNAQKIKSIEKVKQAKLKLVKNGYGELWLIENQFLKPLLKSPRQVTQRVITEKDISNYILMIDKDTDLSKYPYLHKYIKWGETHGVSSKRSVSSRKPWYSIDDHGTFSIGIQVNAGEELRVVRLKDNIKVDKMFYLIEPVDKEMTETIFSFLSSKLFRYIFELEAVVMGGGNAYLTVEMLSNLKIPDLKKIRIDNGMNFDFELMKALKFSVEEIEFILSEIDLEINRLVKIRFNRAKSLRTVKNSKGIPVEYYIQELEQLVEEEEIEKRETIDFYEKIKAISKKIIADEKLRERILNKYWIKIFNAPLNIKELRKKVQKELF